MKKILALLLCAMTLLSVLAGCGNQGENANESPGGSPSGEITYKDTVAIGVNFNLTVPSVFAHTSRQTRCLANMMYSNLVDIDPETGEIVADLATEWKDISENGDYTLWEFKLRDDVKFHNGEQLTAEDVVFSWNLANDPSQSANLVKIDAVEEFVAFDSYTVHIKCSVPEVDLPQYLYPLCITSKKAVEELGFDEGSVVGSGPYKLENSINGVEFSVIRFDDYFGETPVTRRIVVKYIPETATRLIALQSGEIDVCLDPAINDLDVITNDPNLTLVQRLGINVRHLGLNCAHPFTTDVRVRQAMAYAINRQNIIDAMFGGVGAVASYNFLAGIPGVSEIEGLEYNPEKAKQLLAEAGYPDGFEIELVHYQNNDEIAACVQADLAAVGITAKINKIDSSVNRETLQRGTYGAFINYCVPVASTFGSYPKYFTEGGSMNYAKYQSDEFDALLKADQEETDPVKRNEYAKKLQQMIVDDAVFVPLVVPYNYAAYNNKVEGVVISADTMYTNFSTIRVRE